MARRYTLRPRRPSLHNFGFFCKPLRRPVEALAVAEEEAESEGNVLQNEAGLDITTEHGEQIEVP
jgi:hypothetical protein